MSATVQAAALRTWATDVFIRLGLRESDAALVSDTLVEADLRGVGSHGVQRMSTYAGSLRSGGMVAQPEIKVVKDSGWALVVDGGGGMGQIAAQRATDLALERAADSGHGAVSVRNSNHCGAMAYWALQAIERHAIGIAITNAGINMMPTGGRVKLVGNNPVAYAIPTGRATPLVLDMATSVVAGGKLDMARLKSEPIPLGWALDKDGQPTTDPVAARQGALLPLGGPKGYGLALVLDVLCGVLSGGRFGKGLGSKGSSHFFEVLSIDAFTPYEDFLARMGELVDQLHECPPTEGSSGVLVPGEIEHRLRERQLRDGLPLTDILLDELNDLAKSTGAPPVPA
ncbi:MAG: Malate dehydrogenase [uncultured Chloroflexi bacterium]|uniref:Malate dehydrogenase n=1 Tax=uncultured Chloroflexota bacterium TaxID=166587 RepID=A0A6J4H3F6_9CHLR|nr:MAG: Malate dehydrogenase [uncultured Chloroflexota bacterium]